MKIAIDVSQVVYGTGVSVYTKLLCENLLRFDDKNDYILFGGSLRQMETLKAFFNSLKGNFTDKVFPFPPSLAAIVWNRLHILPVERLVGEVDVFHSSDWTQPPSKAFKVTTVHDLFPLLFPKLTHPKIVKTHLARLKWVINEVDVIIVPSETTKNDIMKLNVETDRIVVIPEAPDPAFKRTTQVEIEKVKRKYQISGSYLLSIGVNPRKNTQRIVRAFEKVRPGMDMKLIIVGHPFMKIEPTRGVKILGHVASSDLPALYSGSKALLYPSLYEGFGFPILEAFACETPVVTSKVGTMEELGHGAAVLVDPEDVDSISEGVKSAIKDREDLVKKGKEKVKEFSWTRVSESTIKVYQRGGSKLK